MDESRSRTSIYAALGTPGGSKGTASEESAIPHGNDELEGSESGFPWGNNNDSEPQSHL